MDCTSLYLTLTLASMSLEILPSTLHHVTYAHANIEVATSNRLVRDVFTKNTVFDLDLGIKVSWNVAQYPLHHMTYTAGKFKVDTSYGLGGSAFTRKYIIYLTFDIDLGAKDTWNIVQYRVYNVTYTAAKFEDTMFKNGLGGDAFIQYQLQHMTYTAAKFEVATSNGLGGDTCTFTRKNITWPLGQGHTKCLQEPPTSFLSYAATKFEVATANG